jgi:hypothetical protein
MISKAGGCGTLPQGHVEGKSESPVGITRLAPNRKNGYAIRAKINPYILAVTRPFAAIQLATVKYSGSDRILSGYDAFASRLR